MSYVCLPTHAIKRVYHKQSNKVKFRHSDEKSDECLFIKKGKYYVF